MANIENVVKAIDICLGHGVCNDCPYCLSGKGYTTMNCRDYMLRDALALLKEQEAMKECLKKKCVICPHCANCDVDENGLLKEQKTANVYKCQNCGTWVSAENVVRCKDCKAWKQYDDMNLGECELYPKYNKMGEWFCNFGERK